MRIAKRLKPWSLKPTMTDFFRNVKEQKLAYYSIIYGLCVLCLTALHRAFLNSPSYTDFGALAVFLFLSLIIVWAVQIFAVLFLLLTQKWKNSGIMFFAAVLTLGQIILTAIIDSPTIIYMT